MSQPTTAVIDIDKIDVQDGVNPRRRFDEDSLAELEASIRENGLVTALTVVPGKGDRYTLIAGERRLRAAKRAGEKKAPVFIRPVEGSRAATLVENLIREDLDPIDAAQGLADLAAAENLTTHQQIADRIGKKSASWVSQHLRLLKLPDAVQAHIASGDVPVEAERHLRAIADVSPRVAECVCELAKRNKIKGGDFVRRFDELLEATVDARFEDKPTMIDPTAVRISQVVTDPKKRRDLGDRYRVLHPYAHGEPAVKLGEAEIDAARAAGCLIEHKVDQGEWSSTLSILTDTELAADLAERAVEREEKAVAQRMKEEEERQAKAAGNGAAETPDEEKAARKAAYKERQERTEQARSWNQEVGSKMLQRRGGSSRKEFALARAKALALLVVRKNPRLAASGLRLVMSQLQDVEVKQLKTSGETKEKVSYPEPEDCTKFLEKRILEARSVNEVLEVAGDALVASWLADEDELPQSRRAHGSIYDPQVEKLLSADIKSVRPRRQRRKSRK